MDKDAARSRLQEILLENPNTVQLIRSAEDFRRLIGRFDPLASQIFDNFEEAMFQFISNALREGKEVAIQAAGPHRVIVHTARNLLRRRP